MDRPNHSSRFRVTALRLFGGEPPRRAGRLYPAGSGGAGTGAGAARAGRQQALYPGAAGGQSGADGQARAGGQGQGGAVNAIRPRAQGPDQSKDQGGLRPDPPAAGLLRRRRAGGHPYLSAHTGQHWQRHSGSADDRADAALFPVRHLREGRAATGKGAGPHHPGAATLPQGQAIPDRQPVRRPGAAE